MKKLLLTTTAIAGLVAFTATGASAAGIDLSVGGNFKAYAGTTDQDTADLAEQDLKRAAEIHFNGETTLDNGLTVGVNVEIQAEPDDNANSIAIDNEALDVEESYVYFSGNWGRVNIGAEDGAAYLLQVAAPSADSNIDGLDPEFLFVNAPANFAASTSYATDPSGDADKITFLTPKFNGFQVGVTYSPDISQELATENLAGAETDNDTGEFDSHYEIAARYDGEFNGVGVHFGAGYATASAEDATGTATGTVGSDDLDEYNIAGKLSFDAFSIGAAYHETNNGIDTDGDVDTFIIGGDYTSGAYRVGVSYLTSEGEDATTGDDELDRLSIGAGYTYGPGMSFRGSVNFYEFDSDGDATDNDATSILVGTDISF